MQVQLTENLYREAQRRAIEGGFASVDEYVADVVSQDLVDDDGSEPQNFDHLFTPERLAELDRISNEIKAGGQTYTVAEVREHFKQKRKQWLANQAT
ncbi:MAG TPA: hypothetical protein VFC46_11570 [Humisphaera sp.]|nr:hypothetical protein [Humisphaera sp.]